LYRIIKESDKIPMSAKMELMPRIADVEYRISMGASEDIQLKYLLVYFIKVFGKYYKRE
jgi:DNA polymerase III delta prime subunit